MSDLISRSELTEAIKRQYCTGCDNYNGSRCRACHADDMLSLVDDAADAMPRWISVEERMPERDKEVLCFFVYPDSTTVCQNVYYGNGHWLGEGSFVTHWMPLPEPPEMKEETP